MSKSNSNGFTLVEVLVIAPIVLLAITGFVSIIILLTGDSLARSGKNRVLYDLQEVLTSMERDVQTSIEFPMTSVTPLSPQGYNNSATPWQTGPHTVIILRKIATDKSPYDTTRNLIYKANAPNACGSANVAQNDPYTYDVIYYFRINAAGIFDLMRRVVYDSTSTPCSTPWEKPTCATGQTGTNCQETDLMLADNLIGMYWFYADIPDESTNQTCNDADDNGYTDHDGHDWIHPYEDGNNWMNKADPYSPTTGQNARSLFFCALNGEVIAGQVPYVPAWFYATRLGN